TGLTGGSINSVGTLNVDVGTAANKIMQLNANAQIPAVDGFLVTNINAAKLQGFSVGTATPTANQVLTWNGSTSQWNPITSGAVSSQWLTSGNDIYYNLGNVGIGTATPSYKLHLYGSNVQGDQLAVMQSANGGAINGAMGINDAGLNAHFAIKGSGYGGTG